MHSTAVRFAPSVLVDGVDGRGEGKKRRLVPSKLGQDPLFMRNIPVCIRLHSAKVFWENANGIGITIYPID